MKEVNLFSSENRNSKEVVFKQEGDLQPLEMTIVDNRFKDDKLVFDLKEFVEDLEKYRQLPITSSINKEREELTNKYGKWMTDYTAESDAFLKHLRSANKVDILIETLKTVIEHNMIEKTMVKMLLSNEGSAQHAVQFNFNESGKFNSALEFNLLKSKDKNIDIKPKELNGE